MTRALKHIIIKSKIIVCLTLCCIFLSGCKTILRSVVGEETMVFMEIKQKCASLEPTYFLDYLSSLKNKKFNSTLLYYIRAMRDYNVAIEPMYRAAPLQALKNLNEINDFYDSDLIARHTSVDVNRSIKDLECRLILNNDYNKRNTLYFGRLNNSTPIPFQLIDKIGDDYLILQQNVFDLKLSNDEVYKNGECILKDNEYIKQSFELEKDLIKDIYILSEEDYKKYKKVDNSIANYLDVASYDIRQDYNGKSKIKSIDCSMQVTSSDKEDHTSYWVKDNNDNVVTKVCHGYKIVDMTDNNKYAVRLAILVRGDLYEK